MIISLHHTIFCKSQKHFTWLQWTNLYAAYFHCKSQKHFTWLRWTNLYAAYYHCKSQKQFISLQWTNLYTFYYHCKNQKHFTWLQSPNLCTPTMPFTFLMVKVVESLPSTSTNSHANSGLLVYMYSCFLKVCHLHLQI